MKSAIFIFSLLGFCFNIVEPYHKYAGYRQGAYQPEHYPQNPNPVYSAHRRTAINYEPSEQVVNYIPSPSENVYPTVIQQDTRPRARKPVEVPEDVIQQKVIEKLSDAAFEHPPSQTYPERSPLYTSPERNYDSHRRGDTPENYPTQGPRHISVQRAYLPSVSIQEPYEEDGAVLSYPQWQPRHRAIPRQREHYGGAYARRNVYTKPVKYLAQPHQVRADEASTNFETEMHSTQPQHEHNRQNTYKTSVQYPAQPEPVKDEVVLAELVKPHKEYYHTYPIYPNLLKTKVPVQFATQVQQTDPIEDASISEPQVQPVQQNNVYYEDSRLNMQKIPVQEAEPQFDSPVKVSSGFEANIELQPQYQNNEKPYKPQNLYNTPIINIEQPQQATPIEVSLNSEPKSEVMQQQNEYFESPFEERKVHVPMLAAEPQHNMKAVTISSALEMENDASKPDDLLAFAPKRRRYLVVHQNGTVKHVDSIDDILSDGIKNFTTTDSSLLTHQNNSNFEFTNTSDANNIINETVAVTPTSITKNNTKNMNSTDDSDNQSVDEPNTEDVTVKEISTSSLLEGNSSVSPADDKTTVFRVESLVVDPVSEATNHKAESTEEKPPITKDVLIIKNPNEVVVDFQNLKHVSKSMFYFRPDDAFWDAVYSGNETGGYDELFIFNVKIDEPVIEKNSRSYVLENGTHVEEIEEIIWEHKSDTIPRETKYTRITKNYHPENIRSEKKKSKTHQEVLRTTKI